MDASELAPTRISRKWVIGLIFILLVMVMSLVLCTKKTDDLAVNQKQSVLVRAARVEEKVVPVTIYALGTVTSFYTVTLRPQINGQLIRVLFKEGQIVKKGELLAEIDARIYQAQLLQYEGQLARDKALLANAAVDLKRYKMLWKEDSVSEQILATQASLVDQYQGAIKIDESLIEIAKVNLTYASITSPLDGRIGLRLVDPGNIVQTTDASGIAVITMVDPITVIFAIPENDVPKVLTAMKKNPRLQASAWDPTQSHLLAVGEVLTIDNQIDPTTGTVKLKAVFKNKDLQLFPNQFVNISLLIDTLPKAAVVPTTAIQYGSKETFVYRIVDNKARMTTVKTGVVSGEFSVIEEGIKPGLWVVVEGADRLVEGSLVEMTDRSLQNNSNSTVGPISK